MFKHGKVYKIDPKNYKDTCEMGHGTKVTCWHCKGYTDKHGKKTPFQFMVYDDIHGDVTRCPQCGTMVYIKHKNEHRYPPEMPKPEERSLELEAYAELKNKSLSNFETLANLEACLTEVQGELFRLESTPLQAGAYGNVSWDAIKKKHLWDLGRLKYLKIQERDLIAKITEVKNKITQS